MTPREFCREPGYESAILLTYDFDPLFFERVVLRDLLLGGTADVVVIADAAQVAGGIARWVGQLRELGQRYQLVTANLRGAFHPKLIVRVGLAGAAVWVGSGNITHGGWGANLELGTAWRVGPHVVDSGAWLGHVLDQIADWLPSRMEHNVLQRARGTPWLASWSKDSVQSPFVISQRQRPIGPQIAERWAGRRFEEVRLVTGSTDEGGELLRWLHSAFEVRRAVIVLDPERASLDPERLRQLPLDISMRSPKEPRPVHAKFYWFDGPEGRAAIMGSANCSRAAWLLAPEHGGNVEIVIVYDDPPPERFKQVLERLESENTQPAVLNQPRSTTPEKGATWHCEYPIAEISWERSIGDLKIAFARCLPQGSQVSMRIGSQLAVCHPAGTDWSLWFARISDAPEPGTSVFADALIVLPDGSKLPPQNHWVNDLAALRYAAQGERIVKALSDLSRPQLPSEQQRIIGELQRIGSALLSESCAFPDPLSCGHATGAPEEDDTDASGMEPVDPEKLIRSLDEVQLGADGARAGSALRGLTLLGVMKGLFGAEEADDDGWEADAAEEPEDPEHQAAAAPRGGPRGIPAEAARPPADSLKKRLRNQLEAFLERIRDARFAQTCTVTQMSQAAAFPMAVATLGARNGWVELDVAQDWVTRVFDTLFRQPYPGDATGLLEAVRQRYLKTGQERAFLQIAGDGTLWAAMLFSLWNVPWRGTTAGLRKCFALRAVWKCQHLLASTEAGRMSALVSRLEQRAGSESLLPSARDVVRVLEELEEHLTTSWAKLMGAQARRGTVHRKDDVLWHHVGGWAFPLEEAPVCEGEKLLVYRQNRAGTVKVLANFYLNVTEAGHGDDRIADALGRLQQCLASPGDRPPARRARRR